MAKAKTDLVIVESPAKARTIEKYLGTNYKVVASMGHLRDLPKSKLGVDIEAGFEPVYLPVKGREDVISDLKKKSKSANVRDFKPEEYWLLDAELSCGPKPDDHFTARYYGTDGKKRTLKNEAETDAVIADVSKAPFEIQSVKHGTKQMSPPPPFITSTLQ